jgi:CHASE2 domain-containing sensor protein
VAERGLTSRRGAARGAVVVALIAALIGIVAGVTVGSTSWLDGLRAGTLSARFALRGHQKVGDLAVVAIDDRSFAALHHSWPFPRSWHGRVLEQLHRAGARAVFYDVQFTEPTTPTQDGALFDALGATGGATLATTETDGHGHTDVLGGDANLAQVGSEAAASAFPVGRGGVISRLPYQLDGLRTAAVAVAARLRGHAPSPSLFPRGGAYIDFRGPPGTVPTLSFADVLSGHFPAAAVRGKVVVVGATSPTLQDLHATPMSGDQLMSGPELQANAIWTVLNGVPLRPAPGMLAAVTLLLAALLAPVTYLRGAPFKAALGAVIAGLAYLVGVQVAFNVGVVMPVLGPMAALGVGTAVTLLGSHVNVTRELHSTQLEILERLGRAAESRDGATGRHLERIGFLCERLGLAAGLSRREAKLLRRASALHDVGKIAIPDEILLKPGRFEPYEREIMKRHAPLGAQMLAGSTTSLVRTAETIALTHHEWWNGAGYPAGLAGEAIPLAGRICAICDVFDALITARPYKRRWAFEEAITEIERGGGTQFDPRLTAIFVRIAPRLYDELAARKDPDLDATEAADTVDAEATPTAPIAA